MLYVGQKVSCVYDGEWRLRGHETFPKKGGVYTIREIANDTTSGCGFLLEEIRNKLDWYHKPCGPRWMEKHWASCRFRPIVERKTDISIFTAMLNPERVEA